MSIDASAVRERLGLTERMGQWLEELAAPGSEMRQAVLPSRAQADESLARLGLADQDRAEALDARPTRSEHPEVCWLLERCHQGLVSGMGALDQTGPSLPPWPALPADLGPVGRYFYVWVFLAALPDVRRYHAALGIPDEASWEILGDLGQQVTVTRKLEGVGGLRTQGWLTLHFRGRIYSFGRLQFERARLGPQVQEGLPAPPGEPVLSVHIPELGPLTPEACQESFERARAFFPRFFPREPYRLGICNSWLMDDQLAEYLPAGSNIMAFQHRFELLPWSGGGDGSVLEFVFRRLRDGDGADFPDRILGELPQRTTLERAIVRHLRAGRHWQVKIGWLRL